MSVAAIQNFSGMLPIKDPTLLPDNHAAYSENVWLYSGTIEGVRKSNPIYTLTKASTKSVFRIPLSPAIQPDLVGSLWLEFDDEFMRVLRAPMIEDKFKRYYFFPSTGTPTYATLDNLLTGGPQYFLGIPQPSAPALSYSGGSVSSQEVRAYLYSWVTTYGEEGPPSAPTTLQGTSDGAWTITLIAPKLPQSQGRTLATARIYRTVTDTNGNATYYQVGEIPITQKSYVDTQAVTTITANVQLPAIPQTGPPQDLQGVVQMANGILAGFSNEKEIWFSAPYQPHVWPPAYAITVDAPIVGLGAVGTSLVICTEGTVWIATGVTPSTITSGKINSRDPCISRGSICPAGEGVYYASPNGLILVNTFGSTNVTKSFITKEQWFSAGGYNLSAAKYGKFFIAFSKGSVAHDNGFVIDHEIPDVAFTWLAQPNVVSVYSDELSGGAFLVGNGVVTEWNPGLSTGQQPYIWRSKEFLFNYPQQFAAGKIFFNIPSTLTIPTPDPLTRNETQPQIFDPNKQYLVLRVYADKSLILTREIQSSGEAIRLPSGFKASYWQFEIEGQVIIKNMQFATSVKELRKI